MQIKGDMQQRGNEIKRMCEYSESDLSGESLEEAVPALSRMVRAVAAVVSYSSQQQCVLKATHLHVR